MVNSIVSADRLTKSFRPRGSSLLNLLRPSRKVVAVRELSLTVCAGEILGLVGPNGAGKSTLLRLLSTLLLPDSGSAQVAGHDVVAEEREARRVLGYWADERAYYGRLSPRQNLRFFAALHLMKRHEAEVRIEELSGRLGLGAFMDQPYQSLSSGQKQWMGLAKVLLPNPRVLLLDEPGRSLDSAAVRRWHVLLRDHVRGDGGAAIVATHRLGEAEAWCDRVAFMAGGEIKWTGVPTQAWLDQLMQRFQPQDMKDMMGEGMARVDRLEAESP